VFCPKVTAGLGGLPDTILDRAIVIAMQRRSRLERLERLRERRSRELGTPLRDALEFHVSKIEDLTLADEVLPPELDDRAQDGWEPLLAIADVAGGHWPGSARLAAVAIHRSRVAADDTHALRLLHDCRTVFESSAVDFLPTAELRAALIALDQSPWSDVRGKEITPHYMGKLLRTFVIESSRHRPFGVGNPVHGYFRSSFLDAWDRYASPSPESGTSGTSGTDRGLATRSEAGPVPDVPLVPDRQGMGRVVPPHQPDADVVGSEALGGATTVASLTADRAPADGADGSAPAPSVADPEVRSPILTSVVSDEEPTLWTA
jgi:predicted DNA-binding protein